MESKRPSWDEYFMNIAHVVKERSTCLSPAKGAVLVKDKRIISSGYNGTPAGTTHCNEGGCKRCEDGRNGLVQSGMHLDKCACSHAEENAIVQAALHGMGTKETTLYTTFSPCTICAKMVINAGIKRVVAMEDYPESSVGTQLLREAGVALIKFKAREQT